MSIRKLSDGRYEWRHRVGGRHLKKTFARRADAVAHDSKVRADLARGVHVDMTSKTTVAEYFSQWAAMRVVRDATRTSYRVFLQHHLEPTPLGYRPLVKVRPSEVQAWAQGRAMVCHPSVVRKYTAYLSTAFTAAADDGLIARSPVQMRRMSLPKDDRPKFTPLTVSQVADWADAAAPAVRPMILTQAGLGLRVGELAALRVSDVDFLRRRVSIDRQLTPKGRTAPLKTARSRRTVPMPDMVAAVLAERIRTAAPLADGTIFYGPGDRWHDIGGGRPGRPWFRSSLGRMYRAARERAELSAGTSSHDLRHHYASVLLDAGESVPAVAERIGDTPEMVLKVYGHLMPDREDNARKAIDAAWEAAAEQAEDDAAGTL